MANIQALRDEITNDPLARGYSGMTNQQVADDLNSEYRTRDKTRLSGDEVFQATDATEFANLEDGSANGTTDKKGHWLAFTGKDSIDPFNSNNIAFVDYVFGGGSTTKFNLANLRVENISRAVELNLLGRSSKITDGHVAEARA